MNYLCGFTSQKNKEVDDGLEPLGLVSPDSLDSRQPLLEKEEEPPLLTTLAKLIQAAASYQASAGDEANLGQNPTYVIVVGIFAFYSSFVLFSSAFQAGDRYSDMVPNSRWLFAWTGAICAMLTNTTFNWIAYIEMGQNHTSFSTWLSEWLSAWRHSFLKQFIALCASAGSILPFWYISLTDNMLWNALMTTSALANIPVFYSGADMFYEILSYSEVQWFFLQFQLLVAMLCCQDTANIKKLIEYTKIKSLLVTHFLDLADDFRLANASERRAYINGFSPNSQDQLELLLQTNIYQVDPPHHPNRIRESYFLLCIKFGFLGFLGMLQNFGHIVESYQAGAGYHIVVGCIFVLCNLVPDIGFTIKGILGFGLLELLIELLEWGSKLFSCQQSQTEASVNWLRVMGVTLMARIAYAFSGLSGDQINYDSARYCGISAMNAMFIGLGANIGTAFVFSGPQCELLLKKILQPKPINDDEARQLAFEIELDKLAGDYRVLSLGAMKSLVSDERTRGTMHRFFQNKEFKTLVSTVESPFFRHT